MISESKMKALKKARNKNYAHFELNEEYDESEICFASQLPYGPHAPNKNESKALRRICSQTGLSPQDVRSHKKYRQELAKAASNEKKFSSDESRYLHKRVIALRKSLSCESGLHPLSPSFTPIFIARWERIVSRYTKYGMRPLSGSEAFKMSVKHLLG